MSFPILLIVVLSVINQINANETITESVDTICNIQHGKRLLSEGDRITIHGKSYKVEDCQLQRSYQACGTPLWYMINIVCDAMESKKEKNKIKNRFRRFERERLLTVACCENACTISEMTRYCDEQIK